MLYEDKYEKTEERMLDVINTVQDLTKDRFIASLYIRRCTPLDVDIKLAEVRRCLDIVHGESLRLAKLELTYNLDFAVDDNQRFTTAERLFNRLRSSMACIRKTFHQSCPIIRKLPKNPNFRPSVFERSVLTKGCCGRDLYDITSFDDNVQALYYEQQALFANVILSLSICYRVIKQERETCADPKLCVQRLDDQCQRILAELEDKMDHMKDIPECEIQKMIDEMGKENYAQQYFHKPSVKTLTDYAIYTAQQRNKSNDLLQNASLIISDPVKAKDVILLLQHFDELRPDNRRKMNSLTIRLFCNWCHNDKVDNPKQKYYRFLLNNYHGKKEGFPDWHAVTTCKNGRDMYAEQRKFNQEVEELLKKYRLVIEKVAV